MSSTIPKNELKRGNGRPFMAQIAQRWHLTELPAGFVSFQRISPLLPPTQNSRSAVSPPLPADNSAGFVQLVQ